MKSKIVRRMLKRLPKNLRHRIYRNSLDLPWKPEEDLQFKFVTDVDEFIQSLKIIHNCYVDQGFMEPDAHGLRLTPYQLMPSTLMAVAKIGGKVVATMSLIRDNPIGLPMEKIFDVSSLREGGQVLCEFSSLAIAPEHRGAGGKLLHSFFRYFYRYVQEWYGVDHFVIAVNPSMAELYEALYLFRPLDAKHKVDNYSFVKGAPAVALNLPLNHFQTHLKSTYQKSELKKNLFYFLNNINQVTDIFPKQDSFKVRSSIITASFIAELRTRIHDLDHRFGETVKLRIAQSLGYDDFSKIGKEQNRSQRFHMNALAHFEDPIQNIIYRAKICDISLEGIKLFVGKHAVISEQPQRLKLKLGPNIKSEVKGKVIWRDEDGYVGFLLTQVDAEWNRLLTQLLQDELKTQAA
jgi:hypothetical protein